MDKKERMDEYTDRQMDTKLTDRYMLFQKKISKILKGQFSTGNYMKWILSQKYIFTLRTEIKKIKH